MISDTHKEAISAIRESVDSLCRDGADGAIYAILATCRYKGLLGITCNKFPKSIVSLHRKTVVTKTRNGTE